MTMLTHLRVHRSIPTNALIRSCTYTYCASLQACTYAYTVACRCARSLTPVGGGAGGISSLGGTRAPSEGARARSTARAHEGARGSA